MRTPTPSSASKHILFHPAARHQHSTGFVHAIAALFSCKAQSLVGLFTCNAHVARRLHKAACARCKLSFGVRTEAFCGARCRRLNKTASSAMQLQGQLRGSISGRAPRGEADGTCICTGDLACAYKGAVRCTLRCRIGIDADKSV